MGDRFEELFKRWKLERSEYTGFAKDGIIDERRWNSVSKKVLVVLKEPNGFSGDLRSVIRDEWQGPARSVWHKVGRWIYGTLKVTKDSFPNRNVAEDNLADALLSCAVINLKKEPGTSSSDMKEIRNYAERDKEFIKEEFDLINPDIVICGNTFSILREEVLKFDLNPVSEDGYVHKEGNRIFVDFYHPAAQYPSDMMYYFLMSLLQRNI